MVVRASCLHARWHAAESQMLHLLCRQRHACRQDARSTIRYTLGDWNYSPAPVDQPATAPVALLYRL